MTVTIQEHDADSGSADWANRLNSLKPQPFLDPKTGAKSTPNNATINYKPSYMPIYNYSDGNIESVPSVVMFHEMAHAADFVNGTFNNETYNGTDAADTSKIRNGERVAVGLPIDNDNDPKTAEQQDPNHPKDLTEEALRREMNLQRRNHYASNGKSRV